MRQTVLDIWVEFNKPLEGRLNFMYLDIKGLVSTGVGNLIDATQHALTPPTAAERAASLAIARPLYWLTKDGSTASDEEIDAEWDQVKARFDLAPLGGGHFAPPVTTLHLAENEIDRIVFVKLDETEAALRGRTPFSGFDDWPADAQLGLLSMAWAMGPNFNFPKFQNFAANGEWSDAATECRFQPDAGFISRRNDRDQLLFRNAAAVAQGGLDPDVLLYPGAG